LDGTVDSGGAAGGTFGTGAAVVFKPNAGLYLPALLLESSPVGLRSGSVLSCLLCGPTVLLVRALTCLGKSCTTV